MRELRIGAIEKCGKCGKEFPIEELEMDLELRIPVCKGCAFLDIHPTAPLVSQQVLA